MARAWHHHGGDTPTSPRDILHHTDQILCTFLHTTVFFKNRASHGKYKDWNEFMQPLCIKSDQNSWGSYILVGKVKSDKKKTWPLQYIAISYVLQWSGFFFSYQKLDDPLAWIRYRVHSCCYYLTKMVIHPRANTCIYRTRANVFEISPNPQIPKFWIYRTRANTQNEDIGLGPTL